MANFAAFSLQVWRDSVCYHIAVEFHVDFKLSGELTVRLGGLGPGALRFESGYPLLTIPFIFGDPIRIQITGPQTTN